MKPLRLLVLLVSLPLLLGGCGEKSSSKGLESVNENSTAPIEEVNPVEEKQQEVKPEEPVAVIKPVEEAPVSPNLKYEIKGDAVTITGCDKKASGELTIPATIEGKPVTSIGDRAFFLCSSLMSITIPDSVTSIGDEAFIGCSGLSGIFIPDSVTSIGDMAFSYCRNLIDIKVGEGNVNYTDVNGVLFNEGQTLLTAYPAGKAETNYTIPDSVTSIGGAAFRGCSNLTSITFGENSQLTSIGIQAFETCTSLTSITIGNGVTSIGNWAFANCRSLISITIPDSVTSIGDRAFTGCRALTSITIPDSVTSIGEDVFWRCKSLTSITIPDSVTSIGEAAFLDCTRLTAVTFLGDAPEEVGRVFLRATPTIYRKPEAKGWGDTWAGRPVKLISEKP